MILISGNAVIPAKYVPLVRAIVEEWRDGVCRDPNVTKAEIENAQDLAHEFVQLGG